MKAIILAAWFGTRMLPITKTIPKEMLPVGDKPVIQHTIEALVQCGISEIIIVTSQFKKVLEDYFDKNYELEELLEQKWKTTYLEMINKPKDLAKMAFVRQNKMLWTGNAILQAEPRVSEDFFMVLNGDDIYEAGSLQWMMDLHKQSWKSTMLLTQVEKEDVVNRWIAKIENDHIIGFVEKPSIESAPSNLANTGCVIYPRKMFELIKNTTPDAKSWEIYPREGFQKIMDSEWVLPYVTKNRRPIWSRESWLDANNKMFKDWKLF